MKQSRSFPLFSTEFLHPISHCCAPQLKYRKCKVKPFLTQILTSPHCKTPAGAEHAGFRTHFGLRFTKAASQATLYQPLWNPEVMNMKENSSGLGYPPSVWVRLCSLPRHAWRQPGDPACRNALVSHSEFRCPPNGVSKYSLNKNYLWIMLQM